MFWDEERKRMVVCSCPAGESKRRWLNMTPEQRAQERRQHGRKRRGKESREQEPVPF